MNVHLSLLSLLLAQTLQQDPLPPKRAAALMKAPDGFRVSLVAAEPDVLNPIAMCTDERGRLWVVESHSYPHWIKDGKPGKDRVLIFEDPKHDGNFDRGKVFLDKGTNLSGIAVGHGGVWLLSSPNLLFIPYKPGEDRPSGPPQVLLDGWTLEAKHNVVNGLTWAPDGWLWGLHGITATSRVGKPGTPDKERVPMNCGVWRYHPYKKKFEVVASGTTNPWGLDFDEEGEAFITNCVIKHLFHVVPGAHFTRMYGSDLNPHVYGLMESCADHFHWAGGNWTTSRNAVGAHSDFGGGHAHVGCLIYQGDAWPKQFRNNVFMCNLHGNRLNRDKLEKHGSGYVAKHGEDFLFAHDTWFRGISIIDGPDGNVFVSDWHDTGECHNYDKTYPSGRIYKISYGKPRPMEVDLAKLSDVELVKLQVHGNEWHVRRSRLILQERAQKEGLGKEPWDAMGRLVGSKESLADLRLCWTAHSCVPIRGDLPYVPALAHTDGVFRRWAVRLIVDDKKVSDDGARKLADLAKTEKDASVRLALASALQWLPHEQRWPIAENLLAREEDAKDANLPLMLWYGIEPLVAADPQRAVDLLAKCRIPLVRQHIARRLALMGP